MGQIITNTKEIARLAKERSFQAVIQETNDLLVKPIAGNRSRMSATALKRLNKRRAKNKIAKQSRKRNR